MPITCTTRQKTRSCYLEIGDRTPGDEVNYPDDDLQIVLIDGKKKFAHKDGTPY